MATGKQIRAARVLVGWDAKHLAQHVGITEESILNIERGTFNARPATMEKIVGAFGNAGIEFIENEGLRRRPEGIEIFEGHERFHAFSTFLYEYLLEHGGDVCISVTDERLFKKYRKDHELHRERMKNLFDEGKITYRILAHQSTFKSEYAEHRWLEAPDNAQPSSFYCFGDCIALISFTHRNPPYVLLLKNSPFATAYRQSFNMAWNAAKPPPKDVQ